MTHTQPIHERGKEVDSALTATTGTGSGPSIGQAAAESLKGELAGQMPESALPVFMEYTTALADHLGDSLKESVTLKVLLEARINALRFCHSSGWAQRLVDAVHEANGTKDTILYRLMEVDSESALRFIQQMKDSVGEVLRTLEEAGITELSVLENSAMALNAANLERYKEGALTLADLLMTQPSAIMMWNSSDLS